MVIKAKIENQEIFKTLKEIDKNLRKELLARIAHDVFENSLSFISLVVNF